MNDKKIKMLKNSILLISLVAFSLNNVNAGGPWTQQKEKYYLKLSEWWIVFNQHYTDTGQIDPNVTTGIFNTFLYAEYGVKDRLTFIMNTPLISRNYMNNLRSATTNDIIVEGEGIATLGDIDVGLKYGLTKPGGKIPIAVSLTLGLPTGRTGQGKLGNLQTGDGEFNQLLKVDVGTGINVGKFPAYTSGYLGINNRTNGYSEELQYGLEFGIGLLSKKLWVNTKLNGIKSFKNGDTAATVTSTSIFANNTEYLAIGLEGNYYITPKVGVSAGFATAFQGRIIAAAPSYNVGIFYDFK